MRERLRQGWPGPLWAQSTSPTGRPSLGQPTLGGWDRERSPACPPSERPAVTAALGGQPPPPPYPPPAPRSTPTRPPPWAGCEGGACSPGPARGPGARPAQGQLWNHQSAPAHGVSIFFSHVDSWWVSVAPTERGSCSWGHLLVPQPSLAEVSSLRTRTAGRVLSLLAVGTPGSSTALVAPSPARGAPSGLSPQDPGSPLSNTPPSKPPRSQDKHFRGLHSWVGGQGDLWREPEATSAQNSLGAEGRLPQATRLESTLADRQPSLTGGDVSAQGHRRPAAGRVGAARPQLHPSPAGSGVSLAGLIPSKMSIAQFRWKTTSSMGNCLWYSHSLNSTT